MRQDWQRFSIDPTGLDFDRLLADWRWLVPRDLRAFSLTLFGDWFFENAAGNVLFLDTVGGRLSVIAPTRAAFFAAREQPNNADQWYMPDLALLCLERGLCPGPGKCLSFKIAPVLGGKLDADNIEVSDLQVHQTIAGQIHRQAKELPPGTKIDRITLGGYSPELHQQIEMAVNGLAAVTAAHNATWHLDRGSWSVDQNVGTIVFSMPEGIKAEAPVQIIGTYSTTDSTWLWGWDHPSVVPRLAENAKRMLDYGRQHGFDRLTTRKLRCTEEECWKLTALAFLVCKANGAYRGPAGSARVFMTFGEIKLSRKT